ncbi:Mettl15 [Columba guinea]|nr:Mettl15 [Columba guinea]
MLLLASEKTTQMCRMRLFSSKMLSRCLCQVHKCVFLSNFKLNSINVATLARRIHSSAKKLSDSELKEQTVPKCETGELPPSTEDNNFGRLHTPVMLEEVVNCLSPQPGQCFLDMTFGAGGHTTALLEKTRDITVYALDRDPTAYKIAQQLSESYPKQIRALLGQFSQSEALLISSGVEPGTLDGVLLDAGCSSMQFDTPERGFSLQKDGPLDMRMDGDRYPDMPTAADVVNALDQQALASILRTYGEERHAKKIASAIVQARSIYPITRTQQLASIVAGLGGPWELTEWREVGLCGSRKDLTLCKTGSAEHGVVQPYCLGSHGANQVRPVDHDKAHDAEKRVYLAWRRFSNWKLKMMTKDYRATLCYVVSSEATMTTLQFHTGTEQGYVEMYATERKKVHVQTVSRCNLFEACRKDELIRISLIEVLVASFMEKKEKISKVNKVAEETQGEEPNFLSFAKEIWE